MSKRTNGTKQVQLNFPKGEVSRTEQAHANESDINIIMARAMRGESSDYIKEYSGHYGDASSLDFFNANILIAEANSMFDALPSKIRNRFHNQPGEFLDFVQDPKNEQELINLKLANPKPEITTPPAAAEVTPPSPTPPTPPPVEKTKTSESSEKAS